eukprot:m.19219 g.19219  ORF g.19219 m.19219 type:complete len:73 (+) comp5897_c0_seq2:133-351(+)
MELQRVLPTLTPLLMPPLQAIQAEDKTHAVAIGKMLMSSADIAENNKGHGIESLHYLNDGLWNLDTRALTLR